MNNLIYLIGIGAWEIILIVGVMILLFGATQIPKIARSLGQGLKEFKKSVKEAEDIGKEVNDKDKEKKKKK